MNNRKLDLDISTLIYEYLNNDNKIFINKFEGFIKENYYNAIECLDTTNDKEEIIYYTKIKTVFMIFSSLASAEDDTEEILRIFAVKKDYYPMLEVLYTDRYITHTKLAEKLGKTSQALSDYVKKLPDLGLFIRERGDGTTYHLTNKGMKLVERKKKELKLHHAEVENRKQDKAVINRIMSGALPSVKPIEASALIQKNMLLVNGIERDYFQAKPYVNKEGMTYGSTH